MEDNEVLLRAVETITEKTVRIEVDNINSLSFWDRLLIKTGLKKPIPKVFEVKDIYVGNMQRIGARSLNIPAEVLKQSISSLIVEGSHKYMDDFIYIAACGIQNNRHEPGRQLQDFIRWNFTMKDIFRICDIVLSKSNYEAFINTTVLIKGADVLSVQETDVLTAKEPEGSKDGL